MVIFGFPFPGEEFSRLVVEVSGTCAAWCSKTRLDQGYSEPLFPILLSDWSGERVGFAAAKVGVARMNSLQIYEPLIQDCMVICIRHVAQLHSKNDQKRVAARV